MNTFETIYSLNGRYKKYSSETDNTKIKISDRELGEISSFNEQITEFEIRNSYLPIIELILVNNFRKYSQDKNIEESKIQKSITPLMIGITGSVSVGKSIFSKTLQKLFHIVKGIRNVEDLPDNARKYIYALEDFIGARISSISTSPERDDTILVEDPFNN